MLTKEIQYRYDEWIKNVSEDLLHELEKMDEKAIEDAFYKDLGFGTGGLRGVMGAGTNRMNIYVVAKASQGLANYLGIGGSVVIGYDSRHKSYEFAKTAAKVFAANGLNVFIWPKVIPVPLVSYSVRQLNASAGVMITASHNPSKYNGYKVYGSDGCQVTTKAAAAILEKINELNPFADVYAMEFDTGVRSGKIKYVNESILTSFIEEIKIQSVLYGDVIDRDLKIVYTPLNGTGFEPVTRALAESGFTNVTVVEEQKAPDGDFPSCPYPNPEVREAMDLGLQYCIELDADLLIATDPDCDRCGIAVRNESGYDLLSGNEVGLLLFEYICSQRLIHSCMSASPVCVKTIVTTDLAEKIAAHYGVEMINVLTGFKFIGEVIGKLDEEGRKSDFIFGFEESYGYLAGTHVRDKDGVSASLMICEMVAFYKRRGRTLLDQLEKLYAKYGYCLNTLHSFELGGSAGIQKMDGFIGDLRKSPLQTDRLDAEFIEDFQNGLYGLPKSDVLKFHYIGDAINSSVVIRPSGTEPKLKVYISVIAEDRNRAKEVESEIMTEVKRRLNYAIAQGISDMPESRGRTQSK